MSKLATRAAVTCAVLALIGGCSSDSTGTPTTPVSSTKTTQPPDVTDHEAGPDSPITYGVQGAQGCHPARALARFRSPALIAAYKPELDAAVAQREAEDQGQGRPG